MARGQYDLPLNRASPVYGPSRPPPLHATRPTRSPSSPSEGLLTQPNRPTILVLCVSGTAISKTQLAALRNRVQPESTIQVVDTADATIAALSRKPSAVIVLDNAINHPAIEFARSGLVQYARNGGRLITDVLSSNMSPRYELKQAPERHVEFTMKNVMPDLRADHITT